MAKPFVHIPEHDIIKRQLNGRQVQTTIATSKGYNIFETKSAYLIWTNGETHKYKKPTEFTKVFLTMMLSNDDNQGPFYEYDDHENNQTKYLYFHLSIIRSELMNKGLIHLTTYFNGETTQGGKITFYDECSTYYKSQSGNINSYYPPTPDNRSKYSCNEYKTENIEVNQSHLFYEFAELIKKYVNDIVLGTKNDGFDKYDRYKFGGGAKEIAEYNGKKYKIFQNVNGGGPYIKTYAKQEDGKRKMVQVALSDATASRTSQTGRSGHSCSHASL